MRLYAYSSSLIVHRVIQVVYYPLEMATESEVEGALWARTVCIGCRTSWTSRRKSASPAQASSPTMPTRLSATTHGRDTDVGDVSDDPHDPA